MIILDTCAIIWDATQSDDLSDMAKQQIDLADKQGKLWICDISYWEVAMLIAKKRLDFGISFTEFFMLYHQKRQLNVHKITHDVAQQSVSFDSRLITTLLID